ncbi:hypothetical protein WA026_014435 [Henosepilachna vigintioctopunctata]|uniref:BRISC and BRCA1-A complex member 2 n=1 Tax=Henosepilachna vigintioctopunctata TaxID=420089 RepID=A0AAW1UKM2_9CUCU
MNDPVVKNNDLFRYVHPFLCHNFFTLCTQGRIGLLPVSIKNITAVHKNLIDLKYAHIFKIQVPYAGKSLVWEIHFNPENLKFAPDIYFNDKGFPHTLNIENLVEEIPTMANWNIGHSGSLEAALTEFLNLYKKYQVKELHSSNIYSRISDEYELLLTAPGISARDVEVLIDNNMVHFLISIRVELSNLPEFIQEASDDGSLLNPKEDFSLLYMNFQKLDASKVNVFLQLSPRLEQLIGNSRTLNIPYYKKDSSLVEYVPLISKILQDQIDNIAKHYQFKKEFMSALLALRCHSIIEYDFFNFERIVFLCEVDNYYVLVKVIVGEELLRGKLTVKLSSLYCTNPKTKSPCEENLDYKYAMDQQPDEMAKIFLGHLKKYVLDFQHHSHSVIAGKSK